MKRMCKFRAAACGTILSFLGISESFSEQIVDNHYAYVKSFVRTPTAYEIPQSAKDFCKSMDDLCDSVGTGGECGITIRCEYQGDFRLHTGRDVCPTPDELDMHAGGFFSSAGYHDENWNLHYDAYEYDVCIYDNSCPEGHIQIGSECVKQNCQSPTKYNSETDRCEKVCPADKPWDEAARDCMAPPEPESCENIAGNPINFYSGHKMQRENVFEASGNFSLTFSWLYNSFGNHKKSGAGYTVGAGFSGETVLHFEPKLPSEVEPIKLPLDRDPTEEYTGSATSHWRHNHSYFLGHYTLSDGVTERVIAYRPNGRDIHFSDENGIFAALANRDWKVVKDFDENQEHVGWTLKVDGRIEKYDTDGRVLRVENEQGRGITYTYDGSRIQQESIADDNGNSVILAYSGNKLTQITRNDSAVYEFAYNENGLLESINSPGYHKRTFLYADARFPSALTGVRDEQGKAYSTFSYDDLGRAIRTERNGGAESIDIEYVDNNTRRLTNALGKNTTYHYSDVGGVKRITSVDGEPSANCAAANKGYTYDSNGFIASETDWEGNTTTYTRDNLGRELTRTEVAGTPDARTIITEWHGSLDLPIKITTPESVTDYSYDSAGRLLGKNVTPIPTP